MEPTDRRIEANFSQGWGMAAFITLLVAGAFATAGFIHQKTFHHPRDVTAPYRHAEEVRTKGTVAEVLPAR